MYNVKGERQLRVLSTCATYIAQQCPVWQDIPKGGIVAHISWGQQTAVYLYLRLA